MLGSKTVVPAFRCETLPDLLTLSGLPLSFVRTMAMIGLMLWSGCEDEMRVPAGLVPGTLGWPGPACGELLESPHVQCAAVHGRAAGEALEETPLSHTSLHYALPSTKGHSALVGGLPFEGGR